MTERQREFSFYLIGTAGSAVLTLIPFLIVANKLLDHQAALGVIALSAVAQIVLQLRYFLHIDFSRQRREDLLLVLFTMLILILLVGGTIWIMTSLSYRMH